MEAQLYMSENDSALQYAHAPLSVDWIYAFLFMENCVILFPFTTE